MSRKVVKTDRAPAALGPYSQAIRARDVVYCSGQIGIDPATGQVVEGGVEPQTRQVFKNLEAVLAAADTSFQHALRCTVYLKDMDDFGRVNAIYAEHVSQQTPPARATVQVSRLPMDVDVEIDVIAQIPSVD